MTTLTKEQLEEYDNNGYLVLADAFPIDITTKLKGDVHKFIEENVSLNDHPEVFTCGEDQGLTRSTNYFFDSWNKISHFWEKTASSRNADKHRSINKIGHALHSHLPSFQEVAFDGRIKGILRQLRFHDPRICQDMYIFKQPFFGGEVTAHHDASFLFTEPTTHLVGFWLALESATTDNGCLYFVPGSHKDNTQPLRRFVRTTADGGDTHQMNFIGPEPSYPPEAYVACQVPQGSMVIIQSNVVHRSPPNLSEKSREIYAWHVVDGRASTDGAHDVSWSKENWIRPHNGIRDFTPYFT